MLNSEGTHLISGQINGDHSRAVEARDIAPILDGVDETQPDPEFYAAILHGPAAEQHAIQLRKAIVARPGTAEHRRRGRAAHGSREPRRYHTAVVLGLQRGRERRGGFARRRD